MKPATKTTGRYDSGKLVDASTSPDPIDLEAWREAVWVNEVVCATGEPETVQETYRGIVELNKRNSALSLGSL